MEQDNESLIEKFCLDTVKATSLLYDEKLYGHMLVVIYSSIDSMGLLDAPPTQLSASKESFTNWVKKYILPNGSFDFNELDLYAARCSVLHAFTSESDLSKKGKAKEIHYYSGPKDDPLIKAYIECEKWKRVAADLNDIYMAFLEALKSFHKDLLANCNSNSANEARLRKVLHKFAS
jgi:hypothetical protein